MIGKDCVPFPDAAGAEGCGEAIGFLALGAATTPAVGLTGDDIWIRLPGVPSVKSRFGARTFAMRHSHRKARP